MYIFDNIDIKSDTFTRKLCLNMSVKWPKFVEVLRNKYLFINIVQLVGINTISIILFSFYRFISVCLIQTLQNSYLAVALSI